MIEFQPVAVLQDWNFFILSFYHFISVSLAFDIAKRIHFAKNVSSDGRDEQRVSPPAIRIAISGIAIGVMVMLVTIAIVVGFKEEVRQKVIDFGGHLQVQAFVSNQTYELPPICVDDSLMKVFGQMPGVQEVEGFMTKPAVLKTDEDFCSVVMKGVDERKKEKGKGKNALDETDVDEEDFDPRTITLSRTIADKMRLKVGDQVSAYFVQTDLNADPFALGAENTKVKVRKLTVKDIYETHFSEIDRQMVLCSLPLLQEVSGWDEDMYSALAIKIDDFDQLENRYFEMMDRLMGVDESTDGTPTLAMVDRMGTPFYVQSIEQLNPQVFSWLELLDTNVWVILILIAAVAAFTMISGLLIIILERTQMIGILKAQGMDNGRLRRVFLWVAMFLTGQGMLWGNLIGLGLCYIQYRWHPIALDPQNYYLEWVPIHLSWTMVLLVNLGTVIITLLVLLGPSALVARIAPTRAIQSE